MATRSLLHRQTPSPASTSALGRAKDRRDSGTSPNLLPKARIGEKKQREAHDRSEEWPRARQVGDWRAKEEGSGGFLRFLAGMEKEGTGTEILFKAYGYIIIVQSFRF